MSKQTQTAKSQVTKSKVSQSIKQKSLVEKDPWATWNDEVRDLSYKVFYETKEGSELLMKWEQRFLYEPIGCPDHSNDQVRFFAGRNALVLQIRTWIQDKLVGIQRAEQKKTVRKRK